jgi:hypothetical protein
MSGKLVDHLYPKGRSLTQPNLMPNVLDSDGAVVSMSSAKRITTETTVVNLGSGANTNDGDPLRIAFAKINNFMEASYWANDGVNRDLESIKADIELIKNHLGL